MTCHDLVFKLIWPVMIWSICLWWKSPGGGGEINGKVGTGMCGPDRVLFRALRFCNGPFFYLKIGLDIGRVFAKCIISDEFVLWFIYRLSKVLMHPNLHCKKHWLVLKRALQETNGFDIGSKFASSLVLL